MRYRGTAILSTANEYLCRMLGCCRVIYQKLMHEGEPGKETGHYYICLGVLIGGVFCFRSTLNHVTVPRSCKERTKVPAVVCAVVANIYYSSHS